MRFMSIVGKLAFAAFLVSLLMGLVAAFGTRFHLWDFQVGLLKIFPFCLYAGIAGFVLGEIYMLFTVLAPNLQGVPVPLEAIVRRVLVLAIFFGPFGAAVGLGIWMLILAGISAGKWVRETLKSARRRA